MNAGKSHLKTTFDLTELAIKQPQLTLTAQLCANQELNAFRGKCSMLFHYDMISVPLVYTQVRLLPLQAWS